MFSYRLHALGSRLLFLTCKEIPEAASSSFCRQRQSPFSPLHRIGKVTPDGLNPGAGSRCWRVIGETSLEIVHSAIDDSLRRAWGTSPWRNDGSAVALKYQTAGAGIGTLELKYEFFCEKIRTRLLPGSGAACSLRDQHQRKTPASGRLRLLVRSLPAASAPPFGILSPGCQYHPFVQPLSSVSAWSGKSLSIG